MQLSPFPCHLVPLRAYYLYTDKFRDGTLRDTIFLKKLLIENDINIGIEYFPLYISTLLIQTVVVRVVVL